MAVSKERKNEIINEYVRHKGDTDSSETQIAVLTEEVNHLNGHAYVRKKDHRSYHGLTKEAGYRRSLLAYLRKTGVQHYRELIKRLNSRR